MASSRSQPRPWAERAAWIGLPPLIRLAGRLAWRLEIRFDSALPEPPFVVASNHHSFLDALLVGAALGTKVRFLALVDLFGNYRWLDYALELFDAIPLERGVVPLGPMRAALDHLSDGGVVALFPEGTRRWEFDPGRLRPGAAWLAARLGVPLVPVAIVGTDRVLGVDNRLQRGRVRVTVGPPLLGAGADRAAVDSLIERWGLWVAGEVETDRRGPGTGSSRRSGG